MAASAPPVRSIATCDHTNNCSCRLASIPSRIPELVRDEHNPIHIQPWRRSGAGAKDSNLQDSSPVSPELLRFAQALALPTKPAPFGSVGALFRSIRDTLKIYTELPDQALEMLAYFIISTWFVDCAPMAPLMGISGAAGDVLPLLRILRQLCRRGLLVADISPAAFCIAATRLRPTLLMSYAHINARLTRLLSASSSPGQVVLAGSEPGEILCNKVIFIEHGELPDELGRMALRVTVHPLTRAPRLNEMILSKLESTFQNKLLAYRLAVWEKVAVSDFDVPSFTSAMRLAARALGACIVDDSELQGKIVDLLSAQDTENRIAHSSDVLCVVVEAMLFHKREGKKDRFFVGEITRTVNDLLKCRSVPTGVSERAVGEQLKRLGFRKRRNAAGVYISMNPETQELAEKLARQYQVVSVEVNYACSRGDLTPVTACK